MAAAACVALAAGAMSSAAPASAAEVSDPVATGLHMPLQIQVTWSGSVLVGDADRVARVRADGQVSDLVTDDGVDGVAAGRYGRVFYTRTQQPGVAQIRVRRPSGALRTVADLAAYEAAHNPDKGNRYGLQGLTPECADQVPEDFRDHPGGIDSHPYALARTHRGLLVADAGGNDILLVNSKGIRTVAVLPAQPLVVTQEAASGNGLPDCVVGKTFNFEPVPTDVEVDRSGRLYVTTLPGGPEDPSLGARGSVYRISTKVMSHGSWRQHERRSLHRHGDDWGNRRDGGWGRRHGGGWGHSHGGGDPRIQRVATGFAGATNVAVSPWCEIYVAEMFGNRISRVGRKGPVPIATVNQPAALEWAGGTLYATTDALTPGSGKLVTIEP